MNIKFFIQSLIENHKRLLKVFIVALIAFLILGKYFSVSQNSLPAAVHEIINSRYGTCVEVMTVGGSPAVDGPSRVCTELTTNVLGKGVITQQDKTEGITQAVCFRVLIEKPFMTVNEEIPSSMRITSKVAVLQNANWIVFQDSHDQDSEKWVQYTCPGKFDITLEEWLEAFVIT